MTLNNQLYRGLGNIILLSGKILGLLPIIIDYDFNFISSSSKLWRYWSFFILLITSITSIIQIFALLFVHLTLVYQDRIEYILGVLALIIFFVAILSICFRALFQRNKIINLLIQLQNLRKFKLRPGNDQNLERTLLNLTVKFILDGFVTIFLPYFIAMSINDTFHSNVVIIFVYTQSFIVFCVYCYTITMYYLSFLFASQLMLNINNKLSIYL